MFRVAAVLLVALTGGAGTVGCDGATSDPARSASTTPSVPERIGYDHDPSVEVVPASQKEIDELLPRLGRRPDYKVPRSVVRRLPSGRLSFAVVARLWADLERTGRMPPASGLTAGQKAVFGMILADFEILNGGIRQYWMNTPAEVAEALPAAARRIGADPYAEVFDDAMALWPAGIPRDPERRRADAAALDDEDLAEIDDRYEGLRQRRAIALGQVLARYIRTHPGHFMYG